MQAFWSKILDAHKAAVRSIPSGVFSTAGLLIAIYVGYGAIGVLDETVSRMHVPGGVAGTASSIASPSSALSNAAAQQVVIGWHDWAHLPDVPHVLPLVWVLRLYVFFDLTLISLPIAILLWQACNFAMHRINLPKGTAGRETALLGLLRVSRNTAVAYFVLDVVEDRLLLATGTTTQPHLASLALATGLVSIGKWLFLGAALVGLIIGLVGRPGAQRLPDGGARSLSEIARDHWEPIRALRVHVAVAAFLLIFALLPGELGHQLDDAFLYPFGGHRFGMAVKTVVAVVILVAAMALTARACLAEYRQEHTAHVWPAAAVHCQLVAGSLVAVIGGIALWQRWPVGVALLVPGAMLALLALFSYWPKTTRNYAASEAPPQQSAQSALSTVTLLPRLAIALAVTPLVVLTALAVRNGIRLLTIYELKYGLGLVLAFPAIAAYVGWVVVTVAQLRPSLWERLTTRATEWTWYQDFVARRSGSRRYLPVALMSLSLAVFIFFAWSVQLSGTWLGPWGLVFAFSFTILLAATALLLLSNRMPNWPVLALVGFRRAPLILAVVLCSVVASTLDDHTSYHNTRLTDDARHSQLQLDEALTAWSGNPALSRPAGKPIPLVFVASAGGGIRAAYWTALVLECLVRDGEDFQRPEDLPSDATSCEKSKMPKDNIFLASGISGGSLGLAATQAIPAHKDRLEALKFDFLAPTIAAMVFRDLPNSLLRVSIPGQDRAAALEEAWERAAKVNHGDLTPDMTHSAYGSDGRPKFPLLLLNGTSVTDGCRVAVSTLDMARPTDTNSTGNNASAENCLALDDQHFSDANAFRPPLAATKDSFDNTCTPTDHVAKDLRLSTAALLSARFPYVSPTGGLFSCSDDSGTFDLDGGLIDSSAAGPIAQLWPDIANWLNNQSACYSPKLVIIDNGYQSQTKAEPPARPLELVAPMTASGAISGARSAAARQAAALAFQKSFHGEALGKTCPATPTVQDWTSPNVVDFYPVATPGIEAPLGWTLSHYSQASLENQLGRKANQCSAEIVAEWFTADDAEPVICRDEPGN